MKQTLKKHLINLRGKRINQKFLVFESDDWGAIRIPDICVREILWQKGYTQRNDPFSTYDSLETTADFEDLFEVLSKYKDLLGNHPTITANFILNNPDFEAIRKDNYQNYHSETFQETYQKHADNTNAWQTLQQGMQQKLIVPQFHGAEHLNVVKWMQKLQQREERFLDAFDLNCYAIDAVGVGNRRNNLMAAYDYDSQEELDYILNSIQKGLMQFENKFGFASKTSIAPCYVWNEVIEKQMNDGNICCLQGSYVQNIPVLSKGFQKKHRYTGQKNNMNQTYLVRNGLFEPSINENVDWVKKTMESIDIAFQWGKPAIIGTHRINFAGRLDESRRNKNLKLLTLLLKQVLKKHPDVQFIDSASLYQIINHDT